MGTATADYITTSSGAYPPSRSQLEQKALTFVKECRATDYRKMKAAGELPAYIKAKVDATESEAKALIESGEMMEQAWYRAIRNVLLETGGD